MLMDAPTRSHGRGVQGTGYSLYAALAGLALVALTSQAVAQATPTETTPTEAPTPTPTVLVYCTPPPCQEGEVFYCPGECPGGCGTECATPTPTATPTVTDTPTPCPTGTPPWCPAGEFISCDADACDCHCAPCAPCPRGEVFTGCPALVCPCTCAPAQGSVAAGFSVGLPNSTVDVPIALLLEPGVEVATLEFTLTVSADGFEPLLSPISFQPAAALPTPNVITSAGNDTVRLRWLTGVAPPLSGGLDLGVLNVPLPYSQGWGSYGLYTVNVVDVSATSADGSPLPLRGLGATITRCTMIFFGLVTDAATGDGINGASVCFDSSRACVQTDANGVYQELCYTGQSSGGTYMCVMADGYQEACSSPGTTPGGNSLQIDFALAAVTAPTPTPTDTPTAVPGPEISITPSTLSLGCQGSFDITITNTGAPGTTLEISSLTLAHGYSEGFYGTGFSWDLSQITLPASLASGATLTITVAFSGADQIYPSRLELTCDSNAANAPHLLLVYFGGSQDACGTPTPTPTTPIVDHPTPTDTPAPTPTATFCPTGTPCPTDSTATAAPAATATPTPILSATPTPEIDCTQPPTEIFACAEDSDCVVVDQVGCCPCSTGGAQGAINQQKARYLMAWLSRCCEQSACLEVYLCQGGLSAACDMGTCQVAAPTATATRTPSPCVGDCVGDCGDDGQVTVDEILTMVNIALGNMGMSSCSVGDANGDGQITVDEILTAVNHALNGCITT